MTYKTNLCSLIFSSVLLFLPLFAVSQIKLPRLISDGMVLQRNSEVRIWGWAGKGERVTVNFLDTSYHAVADSMGEWNILIPELNPGGPYTMKVYASDSIIINDILIGDVWVCSGQSNMELPMRRISWVYPDEIEHAENQNIRQFFVPREYSFGEQMSDLASGIWTSANPENVLDFTAVGYFFAKELYDLYNIPIGLINAGLGGSPVEAWISEGALKKFPEHYQEAQKFKDPDLINEIYGDDRRRAEKWYKEIHDNDRGYKDSQNLWMGPSLNTSGWASTEIPGYWSGTGIGEMNGVVWYRKKIVIPPSMAGVAAKLILGRIIDSDSVYINGTYVGSTGYQYPPRRYDIPPNLLKAGENTIVIRVINTSGDGGFVPDKPYRIDTKDTSVSLEGNWKYHIGTRMERLDEMTFIRWKPTGLFNGMIAPLLNYPIKGVIWYQGESNVDNPIEYGMLFPVLIKDWRYHWRQDDLPFLFVQLANYLEPDDHPDESTWALLREAQFNTLKVPHTGMAVTIDIGEWNDIHPVNKKDVGKRLSLTARKVAYGEEQIIDSGPVFDKMKTKGNKIILSFKSTGNGLIAKGSDKLRHFAVAGADRHFVWADARIEHNRVIVWNNQIPNPVAVRYAWADNPEGANLYNKENLPAVPFRTDDWLSR